MWKEGEVLRDIGDMAFIRHDVYVRRLLKHCFVAESDIARSRLPQPCDQFQQSCFACAGRTEKARHSLVQFKLSDEFELPKYSLQVLDREHTHDALLRVSNSRARTAPKDKPIEIR